MPESKIKEALIRLHVGITDSDGPKISESLAELENLLVTHGAEISPQLQHFLAGRSYAKALAYLGGGADRTAKPASPPGGCGGRS